MTPTRSGPGQAGTATRATHSAIQPNALRRSDLACAAIEYARHHWPVIPLRGKVPLVQRGVLDASTSIAQILAWWTRWPRANIGGRVPEAMVVLDVDPRHGGDRSLAALEERYGSLPDTLVTVSGRGDGGRHLFFRRPPGKLTAARLGQGLDIKTSAGYVVLAPSIHPATGKPYRRVDRPVASPPAWLVKLLRPAPLPPASSRRPVAPMAGTSVADRYTTSTSWADILAPHGWRCLDADPDADGARWLHPHATSACSATIRSGCLFVYSPNTPFDVTEPSNPHGYTRFRAYAVLNHDADLPAAARALKGGTR